MTTAALYARISQDELGLEKGVARQLEDARELAESRGWEVVGEYADNDVSALSGATRPQYERLMADAEGFDRIVVYMTSRLWRSRSERSEAIDRLGNLRVGVAAVKGPELELSSASGRMVAGVLGEFDTHESEVKGERVARAALERAQEGKANGAVAYGWRREYETDQAGRIVDFHDVENPDESKIVREIIDRLLAGDTLRGIADDLNERGVLAPSRREDVQWRHGSVRKLALRPANVGLRVHHGEIIGEAEWPPIIDADTHDRVTALLTAPRRQTSNDASRKWLLTYGDAFTCGPCGSVLRVTRKDNGRKVYTLYVCEESGCVGRQVEDVDGLVEAVVVERLAQPDAAVLFAGDDQAAADALERADALRARLNTAADQYADGAIDAEQLSRITAKLKPEAEAAERQAREARPPVGVGDVDSLTGDAAAATWEGLAVTKKRLILEALGLTVEILPTKQGPGFVPEDVRIGWPS